jgi:GNAT superfamily N-acetyltransferase
VTFRIEEVTSRTQADVLRLMREVYGRAMSEAEFEWFFDSNPLGSRIISVAETDGRVVGVAAMTFGRALVGGQERRVAFAVHAATHPSARGAGIFSRLELHNEERAAEEGAELALGFTNPMAGPILVRRLGWRDLYRMRIWARPLRRRGPETSAGSRIERFTDEHARAWRAVQPRWENCLVRDIAYLNWRYAAAPRDYRAFGSQSGYAVVGYTVRGRISVAVVCDLVAAPREQRELLQRCLGEARGAATAAIAVPAPGQHRAYLSLGFLPTPRTIRVIVKPLRAGANPAGRWHFSLGDTDFL